MENSKKYWEEYWSKENRREIDFLFKELLNRYNIEINDYFEFGCAPGTIMTYFYSRYGCNVEGIDYINLDIITDNLEKNNVKKYKIYKEDALNFSINKKYDFVGSYGFIEHFDNPEVLIKKHKELVRDNGYLCITVPNMRYINYLINYIFSRKLLENHNLSIMDLKLLKKLILDENFKEVYVNYYLTSLFQANKNSQRLKAHPTIAKLYEVLNKLMEKLHLNYISNRFLSPYIVVLAKKEESKEYKKNLKLK